MNIGVPVKVLTNGLGLYCVLIELVQGPHYFNWDSIQAKDPFFFGSKELALESARKVMLDCAKFKKLYREHLSKQVFSQEGEIIEIPGHIFNVSNSCSVLSSRD